jgi:hypothetical protein
MMTRHRHEPALAPLEDPSSAVRDAQSPVKDAFLKIELVDLFEDVEFACLKP